MRPARLPQTARRVGGARRGRSRGDFARPLPGEAKKSEDLVLLRRDGGGDEQQEDGAHERGGVSLDLAAAHGRVEGRGTRYTRAPRRELCCVESATKKSRVGSPRTNGSTVNVNNTAPRYLVYMRADDLVLLAGTALSAWLV